MAAVAWKSAQIQFRTGDDDKDSDTYLTIKISNASGDDVASLEGMFGTFPEHGTEGYFWIPITGPLYAGENATLTLAIDPVGHDTWKFDCFLYLVFMDGTDRRISFLGHALNQNTRVNQFPFLT